MFTITLIQGCVLCAKERKAGAASFVTPGQYEASSCIMLTYFTFWWIQSDFVTSEYELL